MSHTILRLSDVIKRTGLSRSSIYLRMSNDEFPRSISLGGRSVGWIEGEIENWIKQQVRERDMIFKDDLDLSDDVLLDFLGR